MKPKPDHMSSVNRRRVLNRIGCLALAPYSLSVAHADATYPSRPITLVVPFPPGGVVDLVARVFGAKLQERLGQAVVVENKPGGATAVATAPAAKAKADGYTLLMATPPLLISPYLMQGRANFSYRDFEPVTQVLTLQNALIVREDSPYKSARDLIAFARANPEKLAYGAAGTGTGNHLAGIMFQRVNDIKMTFVPYRGGAPLRTDLLAGVVPVISAPLGENAELVRAGKVRVLVVVANRRSSAFPDVPTMVELGHPNVDASGWVGLAAPKGTPAAVIDKLRQEFQAIGQMPDVRNNFQPHGYELVLSTQGKFGEFWLAEDGKWGKLIRENNIKIDE